MFEWYTKGGGENGPLSIAKITRRLTEMHIPTSADRDGYPKKRGFGEWGRSSVSGMLKNEVYAGIWHWGTDPATRVSVEVPAIVSREMWEAAQVKRKQNKHWAKRNTKYQYLMGRRVYCGGCGLKMTSRPHTNGNLYYVCPATHDRTNVARECNAPKFRADHTDAAVWDWLRSFLTDPEVLEQGLRAVQEEQERENAPLLERLTVVGDLVADNRAQLERLLDLYLSGEFPKEALTDRKARLEETISALEEEQNGLMAHLKTQALSHEQVQTIQDFAAQVGEGLESMGNDFEAKRRLIQELDVWATLSVEDGQKVVYARCMLGDDELSIESSSTRRVARSGSCRRFRPGR
jgi:site-specific DNA recombinase